jgi:transcriptional regulator with XRE-family HTH domain
MEIGSYMKRIRTDKGMTLAEVAKKIGVTSGLLSQIENGVTTPSVNSLIDILGVYNVPLSVFFNQIEKDETVIVKAKETETIKGKKGIWITLLASKLENNILESYKIDLTAEEPLILKSGSVDKNGERFILVSEGVVEITLPKKTYILSKGDSINFKSHLACKIHRQNGKLASFFLNGTPPIL